MEIYEYFSRRQDLMGDKMMNVGSRRFLSLTRGVFSVVVLDFLDDGE